MKRRPRVHQYAPERPATRHQRNKGRCAAPLGGVSNLAVLGQVLEALEVGPLLLLLLSPDVVGVVRLEITACGTALGVTLIAAGKEPAYSAGEVFFFAVRARRGCLF